MGNNLFEADVWPFSKNYVKWKVINGRFCRKRLILGIREGGSRFRVCWSHFTMVHDTDIGGSERKFSIRHAITEKRAQSLLEIVNSEQWILWILLTNNRLKLLLCNILIIKTSHYNSPRDGWESVKSVKLVLCPHDQGTLFLRPGILKTVDPITTHTVTTNPQHLQVRGNLLSYFLKYLNLHCTYHVGYIN